MSERKILGNDVTTLDSEATADPADGEKYFDTLVGEGKKYKDENELARAYLNADRHIRELKEKDEERQSTDEVLNDILEKLRSNPAPKNEPDNSADTASPAATGPKEADIEKLVDTRLSQKERERESKANQAKSLELLSETYGSKNASLVKIKKIIDANPNLETVIDHLGNTDPAALARLVTTYEPPADTSSNVPGQEDGVPSGAPSKISGVVTWTQAREIRHKDPKRYNSREFRKELERAALVYEQAGKDFFAT